MKDTIVKLIEKLDEADYKELLENNDDVINFIYLDKNTVEKEMYLEKVCDYLESYQIKQSFKDDEIAKNYVKTLSDFLTSKVVKKSRAESYLNKEKLIKKEIRKNDQDTLLDNLQDYTRVFVSLYVAQKNNSDKIDDIDFKLSKDALIKCVEYLKEEKATKALKDKKDKLDIKYSKIYFALYLIKIIYLYMLSNEPKNDVIGGQA